MLVQNIINHLEENDMKISEFARKCGLKTSTISSIINGYTKSPTLEVATKIADGMGVTIDELTKNDKKDIDEIKKIQEKMKELNETEKAQIYAMLSGAIKATIDYRE